MRLVFPPAGLRLPRLRPYLPRPDDPAIFGLDLERKDILQEVVRRVMARCEARPGGLEYALNEVAFHESERLASGDARPEERAELPRWRALLHRVGRMDETERRATLRELASRMADDVAGRFDPRVYRFAVGVLPHLVGRLSRSEDEDGGTTRALDRLDALVQVEGPIDRLRVIARHATLVLVPTHSSHLDSIVLGYALHRHGLPPVAYGAGKNLFTHPLLSFFMHNLGAYRVDRRIRATLYKDVLKTYAGVLVERGYGSLFFPGGTRSRSGCVETRLKLGLAGAAVEAAARNALARRARSVVFVPATINYALVLEAETLIDDWLRERGKARYIIEDDETGRVERWVAFFRKLVNFSAACIVRFGEPLDAWGNAVDDEGRSVSPDGRRIDPVGYLTSSGRAAHEPARDVGYTQQLGELLPARYLRDTVVTSTQLVAHVLYRRLVRSTPGVDVFGRIRYRGDVSVPRAELLADLGATRERLGELEARGRVRRSRLVATLPVEVLLERATSLWSGYHTRVAARDRGTEIVVEDPPLLLYYQNRLAPFAEALADEANLPAAREIAAAGARP
ncbi:MAG: 1-acyl-sn-glycerol-3-phosphate acyltransferase [Myxococcota bacterium]|nr:1-acyl-sn-glycerol-3-phosphate acyltransferase [Myxococcota bacterium]MDW8362044.1 1-acyl-sn-glycerol-3-phosphate acyltransferase [Myxococcales bacterium]